jgi:hypothetical protein
MTSISPAPDTGRPPDAHQRLRGEVDAGSLVELHVAVVVVATPALEHGHER